MPRSSSRKKSWFEKLTGVKEFSAEHVREGLVLNEEEGVMTSTENGLSWTYGRLETPSLRELRARVAATANDDKKTIRVRVLSTDVKVLHADPNSAGCVFQVASQFNLLEMESPDVTPDMGIGKYESNRTQGPACAMAAGAGTIYRQYFCRVHPDSDERGQTAMRQLDCLKGLGETLAEEDNSEDNAFWTMRNGYAIMTNEQLGRVNGVLEGASEERLDRIRESLRVGIMWDTQVTTMADNQHLVTQVYCSALPISYCGRDISNRDQFFLIASLILEGAYEATLATAILTQQKTVFLTSIGGGAFGNDIDWICAAMDRAFRLYSSWDLEVVIVTYGATSRKVQELVSQWK